MEHISFWRLLLRSLMTVQGVVLAAASLLVALFYRVDWKISGNWLILTLIVSVLCTTVLGSMLYRVWPLLRHSLPKVLNACERPIQGQNRILLLLERSQLFGTDALVSIYRKNGEFEEMIGLGCVLTIQQNGLIQIVFVSFAPGADENFLESLRLGRTDAVTNTLVKPTVPQYYGNLQNT